MTSPSLENQLAAPPGGDAIRVDGIGCKHGKPRPIGGLLAGVHALARLAENGRWRKKNQSSDDFNRTMARRKCFSTMLRESGEARGDKSPAINPARPGSRRGGQETGASYGCAHEKLTGRSWLFLGHRRWWPWRRRGNCFSTARGALCLDGAVRRPRSNNDRA
jgi:hypothetical protein